MRYLQPILLIAVVITFGIHSNADPATTRNNWLTYKNDVYGFSFSYPEMLIVVTPPVGPFHIEGLVFCLDLVDKDNSKIVLRIMVREPLNNPLALVKDFAFLQKVCKKYKEINIGGRKAVNCVTCGRAACHWSIVIPGARQFDIFTMLLGEVQQDGPEDNEYPLRSIIYSIHLRDEK